MAKKVGCPVGFVEKNGKCVKKPIHDQFQKTVKSETGKSFDVYTIEPAWAPAQKITEEDVWGKVEESHWKDDLPNTKWIPSRRTSKGMIVASAAKGYPDICPVWGDKLPYKSVTVVTDKKNEGDVRYWLGFVHGGDPVSKRKELPKGKIALRSDYQAW